jgi:hypothetical protein
VSPDKRVLHQEQSAWAHSQQAPAPTPPDTENFSDLRGGLCEHQAEVMTAHEGRPAGHSGTTPGTDRGGSDQAKYGGMGSH